MIEQAPFDEPNHSYQMHLSRTVNKYRCTIGIAILTILLGGCGSPGDTAAVHEFRSIDSPAAPGSLAPHLSVTPNGEAVLSWLEPADDDAHAVKFSVLQGDVWSTPVTVAEDRGWFINWADFPSVVPITVQRWTAHWLEKRPGGTYSYDIALATSADSGSRWGSPLTPHKDNTPTEHGFVSMFPWGEGFGAVWLDGRNMSPDTGSERGPEDRQQFGGMTLRFARFTIDGEILDDGEIDDLVCECCQTDVATTPSGPIVAYRDRTRDEVRDISVTRYADGEWTKPLSVSDDGWRIPGCPVNGPAIAADGDRVVVAWYGAPNREPRIKLAWSQDAGKTFGQPVVVDEDGARGRVDVALQPDGPAIVSWAAKTEDGGGQLRMRQMRMRGDQRPVNIVVEGEYSRKGGFPQMVRAGDRLVLAWPEPGKPRQVLTAYSPLGRE